jgi:hypothetical protein
MTTERLSILAAVAALRQFTVAELAAYAGTDARTVRRILQLEQRRSDLFVHTGKAGSSQRPVVWQLKDSRTDALLSELAEEYSLADSAKACEDESHLLSSDETDRVHAYLTSAEEAVGRSYEADKTAERKAFAHIAMNLLGAANPNPKDDVASSMGEWWNSNLSEVADDGVSNLAKVPSLEYQDPGPSVKQSPSRHGSGSKYELVRRARQIAAFASLSARIADGGPIDAEDLRRAAATISEGSEVVSRRQTLVWLKLFVDSSIQAGSIPPIAILTKTEKPPGELFPKGSRSSWHRVSAPTSLTNDDYSYWVESWAETLWQTSLIPGVVMSHDGTPESNEVLTRVISSDANSPAGRALIIASRTGNLQVAARVGREGGTFYPIGEDIEGLLPTVNHAVMKSMSAALPLAASKLIGADIGSQKLRRYPSSFAQAESSDAARQVALRSSSELDTVQKVLIALGQAFTSYSHLGQENSSYALGELIMQLDSKLSLLGGSETAISKIEAVIRTQRRLLERYLHSTPRANPSAAMQRGSIPVSKTELDEAMIWVYSLLDSEL